MQPAQTKQHRDMLYIMKTIGKHGRVAVFIRLDSSKGRLGSHSSLQVAIVNYR